MKLYEATFVKKNGSIRTMYYMRLKDLPNNFLPPKKTKGGHKVRNGSLELVWDVQKGEYRYLNHDSLVPKGY